MHGEGETSKVVKETFFLWGYRLWNESIEYLLVIMPSMSKSFTATLEARKAT